MSALTKKLINQNLGKNLVRLGHPGKPEQRDDTVFAYIALKNATLGKLAMLK
jgi:hypothetical protein